MGIIDSVIPDGVPVHQDATVSNSELEPGSRIDAAVVVGCKGNVIEAEEGSMVWNVPSGYKGKVVAKKGEMVTGVVYKGEVILIRSTVEEDPNKKWHVGEPSYNDLMKYVLEKTPEEIDDMQAGRPPKPRVRRKTTENLGEKNRMVSVREKDVPEGRKYYMHPGENLELEFEIEFEKPVTTKELIHGLTTELQSEIRNPDKNKEAIKTPRWRVVDISADGKKVTVGTTFELHDPQFDEVDCQVRFGLRKASGEVVWVQDGLDKINFTPIAWAGEMVQEKQEARPGEIVKVYASVRVPENYLPMGDEAAPVGQLMTSIDGWESSITMKPVERNSLTGQYDYAQVNGAGVVRFEGEIRVPANFSGDKVEFKVRFPFTPATGEGHHHYTWVDIAGGVSEHAPDAQKVNANLILSNGNGLLKIRQPAARPTVRSSLLRMRVPEGKVYAKIASTVWNGSDFAPSVDEQANLDDTWKLYQAKYPELAGTSPLGLLKARWNHMIRRYPELRGIPIKVTFTEGSDKAARVKQGANVVYIDLQALLSEGVLDAELKHELGHLASDRIKRFLARSRGLAPPPELLSKDEFEKLDPEQKKQVIQRNALEDIYETTLEAAYILRAYNDEKLAETIRTLAVKDNDLDAQRFVEVLVEGLNLLQPAASQRDRRKDVFDLLRAPARGIPADILEYLETIAARQTPETVWDTRLRLRNDMQEILRAVHRYAGQEGVFSDTETREAIGQMSESQMMDHMRRLHEEDMELLMAMRRECAKKQVDAMAAGDEQEIQNWEHDEWILGNRISSLDGFDFKEVQIDEERGPLFFIQRMSDDAKSKPEDGRGWDFLGITVAHEPGIEFAQDVVENARGSKYPTRTRTRVELDEKGVQNFGGTLAFLERGLREGWLKRDEKNAIIHTAGKGTRNYGVTAATKAFANKGMMDQLGMENGETNVILTQVMKESLEDARVAPKGWVTVMATDHIRANSRELKLGKRPDGQPFGIQAFVQKLDTKDMLLELEAIGLVEVTRQGEKIVSWNPKYPDDEMTTRMGEEVKYRKSRVRKLAEFMTLGQIMAEEGRMLYQAEKPKTWEEIEPFLRKGYSYTGMFNHMFSMDVAEEMLKLYGGENELGVDLIRTGGGLDWSIDFVEAATARSEEAYLKRRRDAEAEKKWKRAVETELLGWIRGETRDKGKPPSVGEVVAKKKDLERKEKGRLDYWKKDVEGDAAFMKRMKVLYAIGQKLNQEHGIGIIDTGEKAIFKDVGKNSELQEAFLKYPRDPEMRELLGIKDKWQYVNGHRHLGIIDSQIAEGVFVHPTATVSNSVLLPGSYVGPGAVVVGSKGVIVAEEGTMVWAARPKEGETITARQAQVNPQTEERREAELITGVVYQGQIRHIRTTVMEDPNDKWYIHPDEENGFTYDELMRYVLSQDPESLDDVYEGRPKRHRVWRRTSLALADSHRITATRELNPPVGRVHYKKTGDKLELGMEIEFDQRVTEDQVKQGLAVQLMSLINSPDKSMRETRTPRWRIVDISEDGKRVKLSTTLDLKGTMFDEVAYQMRFGLKKGNGEIDWASDGIGKIDFRPVRWAGDMVAPGEKKLGPNTRELQASPGDVVKVLASVQVSPSHLPILDAQAFAGQIMTSMDGWTAPFPMTFVHVDASTGMIRFEGEIKIPADFQGDQIQFKVRFPYDSVHGTKAILWVDTADRTTARNPDGNGIIRIVKKPAGPGITGPEGLPMAPAAERREEAAPTAVEKPPAAAPSEEKGEKGPAALGDRVAARALKGITTYLRALSLEARPVSGVTPFASDILDILATQGLPNMPVEAGGRKGDLFATAQPGIVLDSLMRTGVVNAAMVRQLIRRKFVGPEVGKTLLERIRMVKEQQETKAMEEAAARLLDAGLMAKMLARLDGVEIKKVYAQLAEQGIVQNNPEMRALFSGPDQKLLDAAAAAQVAQTLAVKDRAKWQAFIKMFAQQKPLEFMAFAQGIVLDTVADQVARAIMEDTLLQAVGGGYALPATGALRPPTPLDRNVKSRRVEKNLIPESVEASI